LRKKISKPSKTSMKEKPSKVIQTYVDGDQKELAH